MLKWEPPGSEPVPTGQEPRRRRGGRGAAPGQRELALRTCTLTLVLQDVLRVRQHAGEGATEEQAQAGGAREQEDDVVGESEKHQVCHHRADLSRR